MNTLPPVQSVGDMNNLTPAQHRFIHDRIMERLGRPDVADLLSIMKHIISLCMFFVEISYETLISCESISQPPTTPFHLSFVSNVDESKVWDELQANLSYSTHPLFCARPSIMSKTLFLQLIQPIPNFIDCLNASWAHMSSPDWRGSPETKRLFKRLKKHCIRLILRSTSDLDDNKTLMINAEYDQATIPTKMVTPIEISVDEFYNSWLHHGFITRPDAICTQK